MTGAALELVPAPALPDVAQAKAAMERYQELTAALLNEHDWQGPPGGSDSFVNKRGWTKLAKAYGISMEPVGEDDVTRDDTGKIIRAVARRRAVDRQTGRDWTATGACELAEEGRVRSKKPENDVRGTAETRAANRAIANLIGFGENSAEEMTPGAGSNGPTPAPALTMLDDAGEADVARELQAVWPNVDAFRFMLKVEENLKLGGVPTICGRVLTGWARWQARADATGSIRAQNEADAADPEVTDAEVVNPEPDAEAKAQETRDRLEQRGPDYRPDPEQQPLPDTGVIPY